MTFLEELKARKELMSVNEVAELLDTHKQTIYEWAWAGKLPHHRVGSRLKFDGRALAGWLERREVGSR